MILSLYCVELLWNFISDGGHPKYENHYYGISICHYFFGAVAARPREES